jgi:hypothetical protein
MFGAFASRGNWLDWNLLIYVPLFVIVVRGWWKWRRERADLLAVTFPLYFLLHVYWPWDQGGRYFAPILPTLFVCIWHGLDIMKSKRLRLLQISLGLHIAVALGFWLVRDIPREIENWRDWPKLEKLAAVVQADMQPLATSTETGDASLILAYLVDRPVPPIKTNEPIPESVMWLFLKSDEATPAGFEVRASNEKFQLLRRINDRPVQQGGIPKALSLSLF